VDHGTVLVHGGLTVAVARELSGALTARHCGAPMLIAAVQEGRGGHDGSHRGQREATVCQGEAGSEYERRQQISLGAERLGVRRGGGDDEKELRCGQSRCYSLL
jgi:hypothetical protein